MKHDPLCPIAEGECPGRDRPHFIAEGDTWCGGCQVDCQCDLIARVRADERSQAGARVAELVHWEDGWPENVVVNRASAIYAAESVEDE